MNEETKLTTIRREIFINASPERVWQALINPEERNRWETIECQMDVRVGGECSFHVGWGVSWSSKIVELIEQKKMVFANEEGDLTIWELQSEENGTRVSVEYQGLWMGDQGHMIAENMMFGTYQFMRNLKSVLEEGNDLRGTFWRGWLGITHTSLRKDHENQYPLSKGSLVLGVSKNMQSVEQLQAGDVILEANETQIQDYTTLEALVTNRTPGEKLHIRIFRNGDFKQVEVMVQPYPVPYL